MNRRPRILITNDDGVHAPGIYSLCRAAQNVADVCIVAPSGEQSAVGLSITLRRPLQIQRISLPGINSPVWAVTGTPADCVKLAINTILDNPPDLILSGINRGSNAGRNVLYSGTVAAVIEGTLSRIPGMAISMADYYDTSYQHIEETIPALIQYLLDHPLPSGTFMNVNFPSVTLGPVKGIRLTTQGKEYWMENPEKRSHPVEGHDYYWLGARLAQFDESEDCDISWLRKGYAAAVPIHIDNMTDHSHLMTQREIFEKNLAMSMPFKI